MARRLDLAAHLHVDMGDDGVAELVFGPEGGMPATDAQGHAALATVWRQLAAEPGVRCILVRSTGRSLNHWLRAAWPAFEHSLALEISANYASR